MTNNLPKKPGRGRPRLSEEEKALRKAQRESERRKKGLLKQKKKLGKKEKAAELVEETKAIVKNTNQLEVTNEMALAIQPVTDFNEKLNTMDSEEIKQANDQSLWALTDQINTLDVEIEAIKNSLIKLNKASNGWSEERNMIKELIQLDQNQIFLYELKLRLIDIRGDETPADLPNFFRFISEIFTRQPDEVLTNTRIATLESEILARSNHLSKVDFTLGDLLITIKYKEELLENFRSTVEYLRSVRLEMGQVARRFRVETKKQLLNFNKENYLKDFFQTLQKRNQASVECKERMLSIQQNVKVKQDQLNEMQQEAIRPAAQLKQAFSINAKFDDFISNLSGDIKN